MSLQGSSLQGIKLGGLTLSGTALVGLNAGDTIKTFDAVGNETTLLIEAIEPDPSDASGEVLLYTLKYWNPDTSAWENACAPDPDGAQKAIPVAGHWDNTGAHINPGDTFTFGCTSGVIAKCVRWGYKPWKTVNGTSLAPFHQACTRMARADYCGTGISHTRNGTLIDMYDILGIQVRTPDDTSAPEHRMRFEAAWTPDGAYCVSKARWYGQDPTLYPTSSVIQRECPGKIRAPDEEDLRTEDRCHFKLTEQPRSVLLLSNRSYIQNY
jgi:hypothetical protein